MFAYERCYLADLIEPHVIDNLSAGFTAVILRSASVGTRGFTTASSGDRLSVMNMQSNIVASSLVQMVRVVVPAGRSHSLSNVPPSSH